MSTFDNTGLTVDTLEEVREALIEDFKSFWGENIKTTDDSNFGGFASILSEVVSDINEEIVKVKDAFDPQSARGTSQSNLVLLNGITRNEAAYSIVTLSCTANSKGCTIPSGTIVSDPNDSSIKFATDSELVLAPSVTDTISATCTETGPIEVSIGTLTNIDNPLFGWASVTNSTEAVVGENEESGTELAIRRELVSEQVGLCGVVSIYKGLTDIDSVEKVKLYFNSSGVTNSDGLPNGHVWAVVSGGTDDEIAQVLFTRTAGGIGTYGSTAHSYDDPITGETYIVYFSRPSEIPTYITAEIETDSSYPSDGEEQIQEAIVDFYDGVLEKADGSFYKGFPIGDNIKYTKIFTPINTVPGVTIVNLYIGLSASPTGNSDLPINVYSIGKTDSTKIVVTEV